MRNQTIKTIGITLLGLFLATSGLWADDEGIQTVEGEVTNVAAASLSIAGQSFPVTMKESEDYRVDGLVAAPEVIDAASGHTITYKTIQAVGYITFARVTVRNGTVIRVEVLDMQQ